MRLAQNGIAGERFDPALVSQIRSVDALLLKADSMVALKKDNTDPTLAYATALTELVKDRFYHGYSYYSMQQNWLAAVAGATVWSHLSAIVLPDDILKYPMAACSQQAIVLMACLKKKRIDYRKVGFDHHFALEAKTGDTWYYFDPNLEPDFSKIARTNIRSLIDKGALYTIYKKRFDSSAVNSLLSHQFYGKLNANPAPEASFFHHVTKILSRTLFLFPLLFLYGYFKKLRSPVQAVIKMQPAPGNSASPYMNPV